MKILAKTELDIIWEGNMAKKLKLKHEENISP